MQCDELIWKTIAFEFCSYKIKTTTQNFCRNEYNVTGLCNRQSCPLANSRYATIKEVEGRIYLYVKTIERAHTPSKMWEKIRLSRNYAAALGQIDKELIHWPEFAVHKCKQRLTKVTQYLMRMRKLALKPGVTLVGVKKKVERREARREMKAEAAARLDQSIEKELLARLRKGVYEDGIVNEKQSAFVGALDRLVEEGEVDIDEIEEEEEEEEEDFDREFVSDMSEDESVGDVEELGDFLSDESEDLPNEDESEEDAESEEDTKSPKRPAKRKGRPTPAARKGPKRAHVEVEYELEAPARQTQAW
ncbi:Mak16 protein [Phlyctochytrium arcticum]|nr:Mak16 protein [Phlyctochytrium arcticum]